MLFNIKYKEIVSMISFNIMRAKVDTSQRKSLQYWLPVKYIRLLMKIFDNGFIVM